MSRKSTILLLAIGLFNTAYNALLPLHPDEAYYWAWSRHLQLSYFDHPPMVAYMIRLFTFIGHSEVVIRLVAVLCMTASAWIIYHLARDLFSERVADIALLILLFMPVTQVGYLVVTPDTPLMLFWSLTLFCMHRAIFAEKKAYFYWAGVAGGCMLLSKYTGVLLIPGLALFLLTTRHRNILLRKEVYATLILALIIFTPVIVWNAQHDWVSFRFQLMHGMGAEKVFSTKHLGDFLGGQALTINPFFFFALLYYAIRYVKTNVQGDKTAFLFWPFAFTFGFFLYGGLFNKSEANWTVPAYISGTVLLAYWIEKLNRRWIYYTGIALTVLLVALVKFPEALPHLPKGLVMKRQFVGYPEIFREGSKYTKDRDILILSDRYQNASEASYYLDGQPDVHILDASRMSCYNFWNDGITKAPMKDAVYFGDAEHAAGLHRYYAHVDLVEVLHFRNKLTTRDMQVYRCSN